MLAGRRWHEAAHAAGMKTSQTAAYRLLRMRPFNDRGRTRDLKDPHAGERGSIMAAGWRRILFAGADPSQAAAPPGDQRVA